MGSQPPALEKLFDEWAKKHAEKLSTEAPYFMPEQEEPYSGFVRDGIINLESWKKQKVRICFILNEPGGRLGMDHYPDGFDLAAEWNERGSFSKFMFKLCVWTKAIQDAFVPPVTYKKSDVSNMRDELIRSIAVVNIKKSDGQRKSDFERLFNFAVEDAEELKRELEILNPNIIICGENLKFLREPYVPRPPKKKPADAENSDTTVATAESEVTVESEVAVAPAESETTVESVEKSEKRKHKDKEDSTESALVAAFTPPVLPQFKEDGRRNYVFLSNEVKQISKFTYVWGSKLVFSMWTPANFTGTISSNTLNYYAIREVVRAALKAFSEKQRKQKIQQMAEQRHKEKLAEKQARYQKKLQQQQNAGESADAKPAAISEVQAEVKPAATPEVKSEVAPTPEVKAEVAPPPEVKAEESTEVKPKTRTRTKKVETAETTADAEVKPKRTRTKKVETEEATAEAKVKPKRTRTKKVETAE